MWWKPVLSRLSHFAMLHSNWIHIRAFEIATRKPLLPCTKKCCFYRCIPDLLSTVLFSCWLHTLAKFWPKASKVTRDARRSRAPRLKLSAPRQASTFSLVQHYTKPSCWSLKFVSQFLDLFSCLIIFYVLKIQNIALFLGITRVLTMVVSCRTPSSTGLATLICPSDSKQHLQIPILLCDQAFMPFLQALSVLLLTRWLYAWSRLRSSWFWFSVVSPPLLWHPNSTHIYATRDTQHTSFLSGLLRIHRATQRLVHCFKIICLMYWFICATIFTIRLNHLSRLRIHSSRLPPCMPRASTCGHTTWRLISRPASVNVVLNLFLIFFSHLFCFFIC